MTKANLPSMAAGGDVGAQFLKTAYTFRSRFTHNYLLSLHHSLRGEDAIEALTPQPVGDISPEEVRRLADAGRGDFPQVILWGGLPGAMFAPPFTWEDMRCQVERVLKAWQGTPFILGTADQVPPDGDIDMVRRISDLVSNRRG